MKKVIIIDDSIAQLNCLKVFFANNHWEVYSSRNAIAAFEMIFDVAPDLIIADALMPKIGGFQLIKKIRSHELISEIPIIIYSVLDNVNAKFYINEEKGEYYLKKSDNLDELLYLANMAAIKFPVEDSKKAEILKYIIKTNTAIEEPQVKSINEDIFEDEITIDNDELSKKLKEIYDFSLNDNKLLEEFFNILYSLLKYDLFAVSLYSFEEKQKKIFFDIKNIILSPIFQNAMLKKYNAENSQLFKKYSPNLKIITNENEFASKIEFNFHHQDIEIANIVFYSREKGKYDSLELEEFKNNLKNFFKARYINKNSQLSKNQTLKQNYISNHFNLPFLNIFNNAPSKENIYLGIIHITNQATLNDSNNSQELDILNAKIAQKIVSSLEIEEQIYKNEQNEYVLMLVGKDNKQIYNKLNFIIDTICSIEDEEGNHVEAIASAVNCNINGEFNVYEARKIALNMLEETDKKDRVLIR